MVEGLEVEGWVYLNLGFVFICLLYIITQYMDVGRIGHITCLLLDI